MRGAWEPGLVCSAAGGFGRLGWEPALVRPAAGGLGRLGWEPAPVRPAAGGLDYERTKGDPPDEQEQAPNRGSP